ncbi:unnamed protein product [Diatraea saccharalis]|uniref:Uncharacterized protein n=1 Tax=Diatraea saccharalis TaxID=40085 RepID=A0A9N9RF17_9NEOP|nr:unnamed protein product [Diatraea saccharalis]
MLSPTSGHGKFNTSFLYENIRRNNYYTTPDLSDSSFQSLLDEYRALVHKSDSTPMSQVFQKEYFEQYQQNFHQYYGLPEKYNTRNIDHIFKRWKTALTAKIYYTTKRVFAHKGLYNIAREGEAAPAEGIEEKGGEAPLTEGLGVVAPLAEEVGGPAPSAEGEGEQKETEGGGELKSGEELVLGNAGPPGLANRPTMR